MARHKWLRHAIGGRAHVPTVGEAAVGTDRSMGHRFLRLRLRARRHPSDGSAALGGEEEGKVEEDGGVGGA